MSQTVWSDAGCRSASSDTSSTHHTPVDHGVRQHSGPACRLQKCKAELLKQVEQEGHTTALCSKLGAVCGSQGDCHRHLEQPQQAKACYEESVHHLRACKSQDPEVGLSHETMRRAHLLIALPSIVSTNNTLDRVSDS